MDELRDLYQEMILDHGKRPRNQGRIEASTHEADGHNPLCGDVLHLTLTVDGDTVTDARFEGEGCAISTASASMMTDAVKGKNLGEVKRLVDTFIGLATGESNPDPNELGKLAVFSGVSEFPARVKCATLSWRTVEAAISGSDEPLTTE
jgi:nitrogen fixation NifU-like protein